MYWNVGFIKLQFFSTKIHQLPFLSFWNWTESNANQTRKRYLSCKLRQPDRGLRTQIQEELYTSIAKSPVYCRMPTAKEQPPHQASPQHLTHSQGKFPGVLFLLLPLLKTFRSSSLILVENEINGRKGNCPVVAHFITGCSRSRLLAALQTYAIFFTTVWF